MLHRKEKKKEKLEATFFPIHSSYNPPLKIKKKENLNTKSFYYNYRHDKFNFILNSMFQNSMIKPIRISYNHCTSRANII